MKGPNQPFYSIDHLEMKLEPSKWNNIPLPLVEAFEIIVKCFVDLKKETFSNYNDVIRTQRVVNMNQALAKRDNALNKRECNEEISLCVGMLK